jgi:hypothetical protein
MKSARWLALLGLCAGCDNAMATLAITGEVVIDPPAASLLRGQTATLTYTLINSGDETLEIAAAGTVYRTFGPTSTVFLVPTASTPPCTVQTLDLSPLPGQPGAVAITSSFRPRPIPPGESRQCVMGLVISTEASGPFVQQFGFSGLIGDRSVDIAQNIFFPLGEQPKPIPTASPWGLALLSILMLTLGGYRRLSWWPFGNRS